MSVERLVACNRKAIFVLVATAWANWCERSAKVLRRFSLVFRQRAIKVSGYSSSNIRSHYTRYHTKALAALDEAQEKNASAESLREILISCCGTPGATKATTMSLDKYVIRVAKVSVALARTWVPTISACSTRKR